LWYRLAAMNINAAFGSGPLWWVLGNGGNVSLWQQRRENQTTGLRPEENKPTALSGA